MLQQRRVSEKIGLFRPRLSKVNAMRNFLAPLILTALWSALLTAADSGELQFERDIRPLLKIHCLDCHGATKEKKGGLDLRLRRLLAQGGDSGPAIVPGNPAESRLLQRIRLGEMPPGDTKMPAEDIAVIKRWIAAGAPTARPEPETLGEGLGVTHEERAYWFFQPIAAVKVPELPDNTRIRNPIDAFLHARQQPKGLEFAADANRVTLIHRVYLDLLGLPPTPQQVVEFVNDPRSDAYGRLLDGVLDSPHYGERWGRHWLDVAGYADSEGYSNDDPVRPYAYKFRDYVIQSFNQDLPFDQFIQEQLAGDEMIAPPFKNMAPDDIRRLTATGFLRMAVDGTGSVNNDESRNQMVADTIKIISSSLLGLSVGCARCHDHRYDPISHDDYHRLRAVLEPAFDWKNWKQPTGRRISLYTDEDVAQRDKINKEAQTLEAARNKKQNEFIQIALNKEYDRYDDPLKTRLKTAKETPGDKRTAAQNKLIKDYPNLNVSGGNLYQYNQGHADQIKKLNADIAKVRSAIPVEEFLRATTETAGKTPQTFLFYRGDHRQPQHEVKPGGLTVTAPEGQRLAIEDNSDDTPFSGRRLVYARWLTNGQHPLVARVLVNRVWMHHFGRGIVSTPGEFGKLGTLPTHPQLLDWMARFFMQQRWSLKQLHRLMMNSTAYRQASVRNPQSDRVDSGNEYYWHKTVRRLDAEIIRDRILSVTGKIDKRMHGAPDGVKTDTSGQTVVAGSNRRSVYIQARRTQPAALLQVFDAPVMTVNCNKRERSTVASQSLMLMNSDTVLAYAGAFADRVNLEAGGTVESESLHGLSVPFDSTAYANTQDPWRYGYGTLTSGDENQSAAVKFTPYPYFDKKQKLWKGGEKVPENPLGYSQLSATGGHPNGPDSCAIRRWIAPRSGAVTIKGTVAHGAAQGDGIHATLYSSRHGIQGAWDVHNREVPFETTFQVEPGDTIDMIVSERAGHSYDSFRLIYNVDLVEAKSSTRISWNSERDFKGEAPVKAIHVQVPLLEQAVYAWKQAYGRLPHRQEVLLSAEYLQTQLTLLMAQTHENPPRQAMTNYCQALISSNEFLYSD
ncbi:MAG TPA: hypothetical protein DCE55_16865 [Planctomycetaceae bacterium]|nr:hypothetical protein [Planctomycetaceae bacterium]|tara:strand:+ start:6118 stop:9336 length:3219 start_codon:yes stop_codon:yes gene_type:complete